MAFDDIEQFITIQYIGGSCGDILKTLLYANLNSHGISNDLEIRHEQFPREVIKLFSENVKVLEVIKKTGRCATSPTDVFFTLNRNLLQQYRTHLSIISDSDNSSLLDFIKSIKLTTEHYRHYYDNVETFNWQLKKHNAKFSVSSGHESHELILKFMSDVTDDRYMKMYYTIADAYNWDKTIFITVPTIEESKLHIMFGNIKNDSLHMRDDKFIDSFVSENKFIHDYIQKYKKPNDIIITLKDIVIKDRLITFMNDHNFNIDLKLFNQIYDTWWEYQDDSVKEYIKGII